MRLRLLSRRFTPALLSMALLGCGPDVERLTGPDPAKETFAPSLGIDLREMVELNPSLYAEDLLEGSGAAVRDSMTLTIRYLEWFKDGTRLDSATNRVRFGMGRLIQGLDIGLVGMRVGGRRRLVVGAAMAYGAKGSGPIPGNSTLVFDITLLGAASGLVADRSPAHSSFTLDNRHP